MPAAERRAATTNGPVTASGAAQDKQGQLRDTLGGIRGVRCPGYRGGTAGALHARNQLSIVRAGHAVAVPALVQRGDNRRREALRHLART